MSRVRKNQEEVVGQDSFLDVVANLVGILIILVMVVGARAKDAIELIDDESSVPSAAKAELETEIANAAAATKDIESDFQRIVSQMKANEVEIAYRTRERDNAQLLVTAANEVLDAGLSDLNEAQRKELERQQELRRLKAEIEDVERGLGQIDTAVPKTEVIDHLPTPMAKTVFGEEVHLRLHRKRVAYVPWDDFVARLKEDASRKASRLRDQPEYTDTIGPVGGFWMKYTLKKEQHVMQGKVGVAVQHTVSLDRFVLLPETEEMGEVVDDALRNDSQLTALLARHRPSATTVTVWTYPDSFDEFRELKRVLYERGYAVAARPLPEDHPIGGSPDGTRSASQ